MTYRWDSAFSAIEALHDITPGLYLLLQRELKHS